MIKTPTSRRKKSDTNFRPNLIPILDAIFIFLFFLLMSANFNKLYEISSDVPIVSSAPPPKTKKEPLALTLKIRSSNIDILTGVRPRLYKRIGKSSDGEYDLEKLHNYLVKIKTNYKHEKSIILEPLVDLDYERIIKIMDSVRTLRKTDPALYIKDKKSGVDIKVKDLFNKIVFGNLQS